MTRHAPVPIGCWIAYCALSAVAWTCCLPCTLVLCWPKSDRNTKGPDEEVQILPLRQRSLTLPLGQPDSSQIITSDQSQSSLVAKLPLELREEIYRHALGGLQIHILICGYKRLKLCGYRCGLSRCRHDVFDPRALHDLNLSTAVLRTCRLMYGRYRYHEGSR